MDDLAAVSIDVVFPPEARAAALRDEVRVGLTAVPKELQPKWFYDDRGSALFDQITRLPEYYLTRAERAILSTRADEIAALTKADTLVELGSGTSEKTRILLDALMPERFVAFDVSADTLCASAQALATHYPRLAVAGVVGDFEQHLTALPRGRRRLLAFLGSTIGNLPPPTRAMFLRDVAAVLAGDESFLLGVDLVKDPARLAAAYNDEAGVSAEFNRNVLHVLNRELEADFDARAFAHVAEWDPHEEWVVMSLRSLRRQSVRLDALDLSVAFADGELMRTEISAKFRRESITAELAAAGLRVRRWWEDAAGDYAVLVASPSGSR